MVQRALWKGYRHREINVKSEGFQQNKESFEFKLKKLKTFEKCFFSKHWILFAFMDLKKKKYSLKIVEIFWVLDIYNIWNVFNYYFSEFGIKREDFLQISSSTFDKNSNLDKRSAFFQNENNVILINNISRNDN